MSRTRQALITLALGLALAGTTTVVATAATLPTGTRDQADQRKVLYRSQLDTTLARHRALGALTTQPAIAQPAAKTAPATPSPDVNVPATLLVGLVGGLLGGAAVMVGWTATTRQRRSRAARAGT